MPNAFGYSLGMTQRERHQVGEVIITITPTRFTYLVTIEDAATGIIADQWTRAFATEHEARSMARNAYRFFSLALAA